MNLLKIRKRSKSKKPEFLRQNAKNFSRLGNKWRSPKGNQSKLRRHFKSRGFIPHPGYSSPNAVKGMHPCGLEEVLIMNMKDIENVNPENQVARISATIGRKKKIEIQKKAEELKIRVLNPLQVKK